jgi:hypothetical protein
MIGFGRPSSIPGEEQAREDGAEDHGEQQEHSREGERSPDDVAERGLVGRRLDELNDDGRRRGVLHGSPCLPVYCASRREATVVTFFNDAWYFRTASHRA